MPCVLAAGGTASPLDALALLDAVGRVRRDVRIIANDFLSALDNIEDLDYHAQPGIKAPMAV